MADLQALEATATRSGPRCFQPATPLCVSVWEEAVAGHPDGMFSRYILSGIRQGFHIGVDRARLSLRPGPGNFPSVYNHPHIVETHIAGEVAQRRLLGPVPEYLVGLCHSSPIGLIPKLHRPGKWRLIVDLSAPHGNSVNDAISPELSRMHYASVLDAAAIVRSLGPGSLMAKIDLQNAYRVLPVHPDDHPLLAIRWESSTYVDTTLPFGLRSATKIFSAFADALAWVMHKHGVSRQLHYLDDYLFLGAPTSQECAHNLQTALQVCHQLGVPVAAQKTEGPTTCLTFLGIQLDSVSMQLSLAQDKLTRIRGLVLSWRSKRAATKQELQSLVGHLSHAATVVQHSRTFLRRMIDLSKQVHQPHHFIRLSQEFLSDLQWWASFLPRWNGKSMLHSPNPQHVITADASGTWGCGAIGSNDNWFQIQWPKSWADYHIAAKELVPVVMAVALWGAPWQSTTVLVCSDNAAVVAALTSGSARDPILMHLLRFFLAHYDIRLLARHIAGVDNTAADALSRNNLTVFFQCLPQANAAAAPLALVELLVNQRPDWLSPTWRAMFLDIVHRP